MKCRPNPHRKAAKGLGLGKAFPVSHCFSPKNSLSGRNHPTNGGFSRKEGGCSPAHPGHIMLKWTMGANFDLKGALLVAGTIFPQSCPFRTLQSCYHSQVSKSTNENGQGSLPISPPARLSLKGTVSSSPVLTHFSLEQGILRKCEQALFK